MEKTKTLYKMQAGSHLYGLNTPASDLDYFEVYMNTDVSSILGTRSGLNDNQSSITEDVDTKAYELRRFLNLLRQGNTQAAEALYCNDYLFCTPEILELRKNREQFLDTKKMFDVLRGYAQGELKLANGERTGKLGGKRREALDLYGFSPKNFVQLFRLLWVGQMFFTEGVYPVKVSDYDKKFSDFLLGIKMRPAMFQKEWLNLKVQEEEAELVNAFEKRDKSKDKEFNEELANEICFNVYGKYVSDLWQFQRRDRVAKLLTSIDNALAKK
jgi:hypothetical protein